MYKTTQKSLEKGNRGLFALSGTIQAVCLWITLLLLVQPAASQSSSAKITININNGTLKDVFTAIEQQSNYRINYTKSDINETAKVSVSLKDAGIREALAAALRSTSYQFIIEGTLVFIKPQPKPGTERSPGVVAGKVIDEESGHPVPDVSIRIGSKGTTSTVDGSFSIRLHKGKYEAEISSVGYEKKIVSDIEVKENQVFDLNLTLKRQKGQLAAVVVKASAKKESIASLYVKQKNNAAISDGISQEQIRRTPDNNVAQVLKRVSGLTVQEGKFVTVRGMSERYNNVLMNGASLPSTEPNRRNFSFDIIPSNLIDNVVVNKTATPDLPGEFTGGMVQVNTIDVPNENFIQVGAGCGFNTNSTGKDFVSTKRFNSDYLAEKGGQRDWFNKSFFNEYKKNHEQYFLNPTDEQSFAVLKKMGSSIPNNYGLYNYKAKPLQNYQISVGGSQRFKDESRLGLVLAATYRHEETVEDYDAKLFQGPTIINNAHDYNFISSLGAIGNIAYQTKKHKFVWRNLFNRRLTHETNYRDARDEGSGDQLSRQYISIVEQAMLFHSRLEAEHNILWKGTKVDWFADMATVTKSQPDSRFSKALIEGIDSATGKEFIRYPYPGVQATTLAEGGIFASDLKETKKNIGANLQVPFTWNHLTQKIKAGYWGTFRDASYRQMAVVPKVKQLSDVPDSVGLGKADYEIFAQDNFAKGYYYYALASMTGWSPSDSYEGKQQLHAGYLMLDLALIRKLRLIGGLRMEDNTMKIQALTRNNITNNVVDSLISYHEKNWLPSVNVIYSLTSALNVRAAYYTTVARADFRERSPYAYYDFIMKQSVLGASGLKNSSINNADLRIEWYPGAGEIISITGFYKKFRDPVELVSYQGTDGNFILFYYNLSEAENKGVEFDIRKSLRFINTSSVFLNNLYISSNFTWMDSKVNYDPWQLRAAADGSPIPERKEAVFRKRPLSGLSPYIINAGLSYQGDLVGANITYNRFGKRVLFAGMKEEQDTYETPRDVVDLQLSLRLMKKKMEIRLNAADILHQDFVEYMNQQTNGETDPKGMGYNKDADWTLRRMQRGSNYSFTISYRF